MSLICLVTAMTAEARPLVDEFQLSALPQRGLNAWIGDGVCLLQTGMGAQRAAARIDTLLSVQSGINAFVNVGIAGGNHPLGSVVLADTIIDNSTGKQWFPHLPPHPVASDLANCAVISVAEPSSDYRNDSVFDMEAAAVIKIASQHTDLSRIQAIKVVSDNHDQPLSNFSVKDVSPLMQNTLPGVHALVNWLATSSHRETTDMFGWQVQTLANHITDVCHHSVTETHLLRRLLQRYFALHGSLPTLESLGHLDSSSKLLQRLETEVSSHPVIY